MKLTKRRLGVIVAIVIVLLLTGYAFRPNPVAVDVTRVERGPLQVTVDEDGLTRLRERYSVAAPVSGRMERIALRPGDAIDRGSVLVRIRPMPLDSRQALELDARVASAEHTRGEAEAVVKRAVSALEQAKRETTRLRALAAQSIVSRQLLEEATTTELIRAKELEANRFAAETAAFNVEVARAGLVALQDGGQSHEIVIHSPVPGRVLRVLHESEGVVAAGTGLVEIGDPRTLEIVIDVLTSDAVKVRPNDEVIIDDWGGDHPLRAVVRLVEPSAFTKISALGVEEQRVNVIADFVDAPATLGDAYRVDTHIVVWKGTALRVTNTALFREADQWSLFTVENGRAHLRHVRIGHRSATETEIVDGLAAGATIVAHPSDEVRDSTRIRARTP